MEENKDILELNDKDEIDDSAYDMKDVDPEKHDVKRTIGKEEGDPEKGEPPFRAITEEVTPNEYKVKITPDEWKPNGTIFECEITVPGIHSSCICHVYPDDDMIANKATDRAAAQQILKYIYKNEKLMIETDTYKIKCKWIGDAPTETIYLELEELPFFDCPGSKFGL